MEPATSDTDSDVTKVAEEHIQGILDSRDLYVAKTKHERRLLRCVRDLSDFIASKRGVEPSAFWRGFRRWSLENASTASSHANAFMSHYLTQKGHQASARHTVRLYFQIWRVWGINVSKKVQEQVKALEKQQWDPARVTRLSQLQQAKTKQYESLGPKWRQMVEYMASVAPTTFRSHLESVANNRGGGSHASVAISSFNEMAVVANKNDMELNEILLGTLAYASLLRYTGMRSITGANVTLEDFTAQPDGGVLLRRMEKKCGSVRNVEKVVYVRIVPHKDPVQCTLVHLARFFHAARDNSTCAVQPFSRGFRSKPGQDPVNFCKLLQRRYIAILHAVAIACGLEVGLGEKRLHIFRVMCENVLGGLGATAKERQDYIGWAHDTQAQNYSSLKHRALNSTAPFLMSGRQNKGDEPHSMWDFFDKAPGSYWDKVYYLVSAAGFIHGSKGSVDAAFQAQLTRHIAKETKVKEKTDPRLLLKRVRELENELQQERKKIARVEAQDGGSCSPKEALLALVATLKARNKDDDFPSLCAQRLEEVARLIDAGSGQQNSFCLQQSTASGKDLIRILTLAAIAPSKPTRGLYRNWFAFINGEKRKQPLLRCLDTTSWTSFRRSMK